VETEELLKESVKTRLRGPPRITLEEMDGDEVIVRVAATPLDPADGPQLASEVLRAISPQVASTSPTPVASTSR
jgi:hypothetical protein